MRKAISPAAYANLDKESRKTIMISDLNERRKYKRVKGFFQATLVPNSDFVVEFSCDARDISEGGIKIVIAAEPLKGHEVDIIFKLPDSSAPLKIPSEVAWTRSSDKYKNKYEAGIRFLPLSVATRKRLQDYVIIHGK